MPEKATNLRFFKEKMQLGQAAAAAAIAMALDRQTSLHKLNTSDLCNHFKAKVIIVKTKDL